VSWSTTRAVSTFSARAWYGRLVVPQSLIVREAIAQYAAREQMLSDDERQRLLRVLQQIKRRPAGRSEAAVDRELNEIRHTRRTGWTRPAR